MLPLPVLAASQLPAADAARVVLPSVGAEMVTVISLMTVLSLLNNTMLTTPRILYGVGRDGLLSEKAAIVSDGGTPRMALAVTSIFVLVGSLAFLVAAVAEDPRSGLIAAVFLAGCAPAYAWLARGRRLRMADARA